VNCCVSTTVEFFTFLVSGQVSYSVKILQLGFCAPLPPSVGCATVQHVIVDDSVQSLISCVLRYGIQCKESIYLGFLPPGKSHKCFVYLRPEKKILEIGVEGPRE